MNSTSQFVQQKLRRYGGLSILHRQLCDWHLTVRAFSSTIRRNKNPYLPVGNEALKAAWEEYERWKNANKGEINPGLYSFTFSRSSGPGGQNVNKLNTKATLKLPLSSLSVPSYVLQNLKSSAHHVSNPAPHGALQITSQEHRTQHDNRDAAIKRLWKIVCVEGWEKGLGGVTSERKIQEVSKMKTAYKAKLKKEKMFLKAKKSDRRM